MIKFARAGGIAAAVLALAATATLADPLNATQIGVVPQQASYLDHATAMIDDTASAVNVIGDVETLTAHVIKAADAATPRPRALPELVDTFAAVDVSDAEEDCLANAVYFEARGESIEGQLAVAQVVLNRVASKKYPNTICEVVTQKAQFSFVENGVIPAANRASKPWKKAVAISQIALNNLDSKLSDQVLWYHADYVAPVWRKALDKETKIGLHIFYS